MRNYINFFVLISFLILSSCQKNDKCPKLSFTYAAGDEPNTYIVSISGGQASANYEYASFSKAHKLTPADSDWRKSNIVLAYKGEMEIWVRDTTQGACLVSQTLQHTVVVPSGGGGYTPPQTGTITDWRDNSSYDFVTVGNIYWLTKDAEYDVAGSVSNGVPSSSGRLYHWSAAQSACPSGWRLATDEDWKSLEIAAGLSAGDAETTGPRGTHATALKGTTVWANAGTNTQAVNLLPTGFGVMGAMQSGQVYVYGNGVDTNYVNTANFWAIGANNVPFVRIMDDDGSSVIRDSSSTVVNNQDYSACRCVQNVPAATPSTYGYTEDHDGELYVTAKVGPWTYIAENLRTTKTSTGEEIPSYENPDNPSPKYGKLYKWNVVVNDESTNSPSNKGICPTGFHIARLNEAGSMLYNNSGDGEILSLTGWNGISPTNSLGFNMYPSGMYSSGGFLSASPGYQYLGTKAYFWVNELNGPTQKIWWAEVESNDGRIAFVESDSLVAPCRCVKD